MSEACLGTCQTSMMEFLAKISDFLFLHKGSVIDAQQVLKYVSNAGKTYPHLINAHHKFSTWKYHEKNLNPKHLILYIVLLHNDCRFLEQKGAIAEIKEII